MYRLRCALRPGMVLSRPLVLSDRHDAMFLQPGTVLTAKHISLLSGWEGAYVDGDVTHEVPVTLDSYITPILNDLYEYDGYTCRHSEGVASLAVSLGALTGMPDLEGLCHAGLLHDVGKCLISASIINKPGRLTDDEMSLIRHHPVASYNYARRLGCPAEICRGIIEHHERLDGSGYPYGIKDISWYGRILAIADVFDALTHKRSYHSAMSPKDALLMFTPDKYDKDIYSLLSDCALFDNISGGDDNDS
jgi:putative nucleotidyltransferase with HDIG domain